MTPSRKEAVGVAALALVHVGLGLWLLPDSMFSKYPDAARLLAAGRLNLETGADFSPFYLWLNAACPPGALRVLQSLIGGGCVAGVYVIARTGFGRVAGFVGAGAFSLALPVLLYEATLEPDVWIMGLNTLALALLLQPNPRAC